MTHAVRRFTLASIATTASIGTLALLAGGAGATSSASSAQRTAAPPDRPVIIEVTGDAENGFGLTYDDGSSAFPPTDSEARAECSEHDTRIARVRCRVGVRTWYRDLGDLKRSIMFTQEHSGG